MWSLTGTEDAELLNRRYDVEVRCEEVHKRTGINDKYKNAEAVYSHLLPRKKYDTLTVPEGKESTSKGIENIFVLTTAIYVGWDPK